MAIEHQTCYRCRAPLRVHDKSLAGQTLPCPDCGCQLQVALVQGELRLLMPQPGAVAAPGTIPVMGVRKPSFPAAIYQQAAQSIAMYRRTAQQQLNRRLGAIRPQSIALAVGVLLLGLVAMLVLTRDQDVTEGKKVPRPAIAASPTRPEVLVPETTEVVAKLDEGRSSEAEDLRTVGQGPPGPPSAVDPVLQFMPNTEASLTRTEADAVDDLPASALSAISSAGAGELALHAVSDALPIFVAPSGAEPPFDLAAALDLQITAIRTTSKTTRKELLELLGELLGRPVRTDLLPAELQEDYLAAQLSIDLSDTSLADVVKEVLSNRYELQLKDQLLQIVPRQP